LKNTLFFTGVLFYSSTFPSAMVLSCEAASISFDEPTGRCDKSHSSLDLLKNPACKKNCNRAIQRLLIHFSCCLKMLKTFLRIVK